RQISYWKNSYTLFAHTLEVTKNNGIAEQNFGEALMEMGRPEEALPHFEAAVRLLPQLAAAHYNLGTALHLENRLDETAQEYRLALHYGLEPLEAARAHNNLGNLLISTGKSEAARKELNQAIALNPQEQNSYLGRGRIEYSDGNWNAAASDFNAAAHIAPSPV